MPILCIFLSKGFTKKSRGKDPLDKKRFKDKKKFDDQIKSKLTLSKMEKIIKLKFKYMGDSNRVPSLVSYYIYQAVLFKNLEKDQDIIEYVNSCLNTDFKNA